MTKAIYTRIKDVSRHSVKTFAEALDGETLECSPLGEPNNSLRASTLMRSLHTNKRRNVALLLHEHASL